MLWAWASATPWRELGFVRPKSWTRTILLGLLCGGVFKLVMKAIVMPLLGAPTRNSAYQFLVGNTALLWFMLLLVIISAGFGEETFFRGYLFERLGKLFGRSKAATVAIVLLTSLFFAAGHYAEQGLAGSEQALITGLAFGSIFAFTRQLPFVMIMHAAFDIVAVFIIYYDLEATVAHLILR